MKNILEMFVEGHPEYYEQTPKGKTAVLLMKAVDNFDF